MIADPMRTLVLDRPTTPYAGASSLAPKLTPAATRARHRSAEPLSDADPSVQRLAPALIRRESSSPTTPPAARPIAKSP